MAQPNVAREPSMEEILASIRRIIESNDPGGDKAVSGSLPPVYGGEEDEMDDTVHLTVEDDLSYAAADIVPANDAGIPIQSSAASYAAQPASAEKAQAKNISLADLAARVRSASERADRMSPMDQAPQHADAFRAESPVMTSRMAELRAVPARPMEPQFARAVVVPAETVAIEPAPVALDTAAFEAAAMADVEAATVAAPVVAEPAMPEVQASVSAVSGLNALVSAATVEQVSRSFGELAAAIDGQQRRSLDEMAEDMLRPMLQEWLDDNLPTLVERLVREEIERVARGPRR
ncbi:MAG: DUF2497 domain-containing protein [Shinella sp.]|nr:MAG: DUF2497 domain-containing protein [Shinella sp.]